MTPETLQIILQVISAIGVPIITAIVAWITNSLRKTNLRIDALEKRFNENQLQDAKERGKLNTSLAALDIQVKELNITIKRFENWLINNKKL